MKTRIIFGSMLVLPAMLFACSGDDDDATAGTGGTAGKTGQAGASANDAGDGNSGGAEARPGSAGPADSTKNDFEPTLGDSDAGQDVFRFETFGNEGFWTGTLQLPQGIVAAKLTPVQALTAGLSVDIDRVPAAMIPVIAAELKTDLSAKNAPNLNDPAVTVALIEANAVLGVSARNVKKLNGKLDIDATDVYAGESVGVTCALCHSVTDGSVFSLPKGGSIGKRMDGPTNHNLNVGASVALALNSRAFYPTLALDLVANKGGSVSRLGPGKGLISKAATEKEVDAYLNDPARYPVGMFDDAPDGDGAPMHITPMFRADLAAPWGSEGSIELLHNFSNLVYTALLDPTDLTTEGGRKFLMDRGGPAGVEIADNYGAVLADIGIPKGATGYPFVGREGRTDVSIGLDAGASVQDSFIGMRVDETKLFDLNAYMSGLAAPAGVKTDTQGIARGRLVFREQCTSCHNDDQSRFVPQNIVAFNDSVELFANAPERMALWPAYAGKLAAKRDASGLVPVRDSVGTFDDKLIIVEASNRMQPRGDALPLLMDLARKPSFLHDDSVSTLADLLDPAARDADAPHPFFITDAADRADVVKFLESLDDQPLP
jgi:mono/diheme cytochrome c family protein